MKHGPGSALQAHTPLAERLRPKSLGSGMARRRASDSPCIAIGAVLGGVKDIREAVERAEMARGQNQWRTPVLVDEVPRLDKTIKSLLNFALARPVAQVLVQDLGFARESNG